MESPGPKNCHDDSVDGAKDWKRYKDAFIFLDRSSNLRQAKMLVYLVLVRASCHFYRFINCHTHCYTVDTRSSPGDRVNLSMTTRANDFIVKYGYQ
eukprot:XP_001705904.1 Hypothetical protein GL50803_36817 [Giardia lamblia ATCC 50803]